MPKSSPSQEVMGKPITHIAHLSHSENDNLNVGLGGNIGKSFAMQVAQENFDYYVLEVSSFQLDDIQNFRPYISFIVEFESRSSLTNTITTTKNMLWQNLELAENQVGNNYFIYNKDDEMRSKLPSRIRF